MHYILKNKIAIACDIEEWKISDFESKIVKKTKISHGIEVSTVFLGFDHNHGKEPISLFETTVFNDYEDGEMMRYSTWDEAEKGHIIVVNKISERIISSNMINISDNQQTDLPPIRSNIS